MSNPDRTSEGGEPIRHEPEEESQSPAAEPAPAAAPTPAAAPAAAPSAEAQASAAPTEQAAEPKPRFQRTRRALSAARDGVAYLWRGAGANIWRFGGHMRAHPKAYAIPASILLGFGLTTFGYWRGRVDSDENLDAIGKDIEAKLTRIYDAKFESAVYANKKAFEKAKADLAKADAANAALAKNPASIALVYEDADSALVQIVGNVSLADYLKLKSGDHSVDEGSEYPAFAANKGFEEELKKVAEGICGGVKEADLQVWSVFDYVRRHTVQTEMPEAGEKDPYARLPLETLADQSGSQADRTIAAAGLLHSLGHEFVFLHYAATDKTPETLALAVNVELPESDKPRAFYEFGGKKFYHFDPAAAFVGDMPKYLEGAEAKVYAMPKTAKPNPEKPAAEVPAENL